MLSRVADSLYWMGRYIERAEHTARLLAVKLESMIEQSPEDAEASVDARRRRTGRARSRKAPDAFAITRSLAFDRQIRSSLISSLACARDNARQVREQLSTEVWEHLNRLYLGTQARRSNRSGCISRRRSSARCWKISTRWAASPTRRLRHGEGWHFLELGRYIERAQLVSRLLDIHFGIVAPGYTQRRRRTEIFRLAGAAEILHGIRALLQGIHRRAAGPSSIAQFLLFDPEFPHSVRFSVDRVVEALVTCGARRAAARRAVCERLAGRLKASVDFGQIDELIGGSIDTFLVNITRQCEQIHDAVYAAYIAYGAETVL